MNASCVHVASALYSAHQACVLLPTKKRYIYGGKQHRKRKRESDKTDSFPLFVIFQFNSVTEDRKAD